MVDTSIRLKSYLYHIWYAADQSDIHHCMALLRHFCDSCAV